MSTKIHAVDRLGHLARFRLTVGQHHDITEAENLIERFAPHTPAVQMTGLLIAWAASIGGGAIFYAQIECRAQRLLAKK